MCRYLLLPNYRLKLRFLKNLLSKPPNLLKKIETLPHDALRVVLIPEAACIIHYLRFINKKAIDKD